MDVTPMVPSGRQVIEAYSPGGFQVSGERYQGPVLVFPESTVPWEAAASFTDLTVKDFQPILEAVPRVEVLLLGCGPKMALIPSALRQALRKEGLVIDAMDTGAACRTYNVLMTEDRRVCAALFPV